MATEYRCDYCGKAITFAERVVIQCIHRGSGAFTAVQEVWGKDACDACQVKLRNLKPGDVWQ